MQRERQLHLLLLAAPPLLGIRLVHDPAATLQAHDPAPAAVGGRDPAVPFTRDNVSWRHKLSRVTATTGAADLSRFRTPHLVVIVRFPDQRMGDFMQEGVRDLFPRCLLRECVRERDHLRGIPTTPRAFPPIIKLETPPVEVMLLQQ